MKLQNTAPSNMLCPKKFAILLQCVLFFLEHIVTRYYHFLNIFLSLSSNYHSHSHSLISFSQILPLVGLMGLNDCKWVVGSMVVDLTMVGVGWDRGLKLVEAVDLCHGLRLVVLVGWVCWLWICGGWVAEGWSSKRLGWVLAAVLWWVKIGVEIQIEVAEVVGFGCGFVAVLWWALATVCAMGFFFFFLVVRG